MFCKLALLCSLLEGATKHNKNLCKAPIKSSDSCQAQSSQIYKKLKILIQKMEELNIEPRDYQKAIYKTCIEKDCLVVLPTGTGKTLIALMLTIDRFKKFPLKKILILAPTRPLIEQHLESFKKNLPENWADMHLFTGKTPAEKRKEIWQTAEFIFSTPQCIANDLKKNLYDLSEVSLLIVDECHRCLKNYAYNHVAQKYKEQAIERRVVGLTASPGSDKKTISQVCENLGIEAVEIRTRESIDVKPHLQKLDFEKIEVDFPSELEEIKILLEELQNQKINEVKQRGFLHGYASKTMLLKTQNKLMEELRRGRDFNKMFAVSSCAQALKISHALELLETQTVQSFIAYLKDLFKQSSEKKSKGVQKLTKDPRFAKAFTLATALSIEHPKIEKLVEIIKAQFEKEKNSKIIVFAQFRETVRKISEELNKLECVKADNFVGQAIKDHGKGNTTGLKQKEQKEMIEKFKSGKINVLVATSLHPDEFIILKHKGKILIKKIGEFVESFLVSKNPRAISKKISGWYALSTDGNKIIFKPITQVHRHISKNDLIDIKLNSGFDTKITKDHSLFSFNKEKDFTASKPHLNKFIAIASNCPNNIKKDRIDIQNEIIKNNKKSELKNIYTSFYGLSQSIMRQLNTDYKALNAIAKSSLNISEISRMAKKDYSTMINCLKRLKEKKYITQERKNKNYMILSHITPRGLKYLKFLDWFLNNKTYQKGKYKSLISSANLPSFNEYFPQKINISYGKTPFPRFIYLNKYTARFLGYYVSEGHVRKTKSTSGVFLAARAKKMQDLMKESIEKGLKLKARKSWRGIAIDSQISYYLIKDVFKAGIGSYNKEVPENIFTAENKIKWEFLNAYIQGDGHIGKDRIIITTVSRKLIVGLMFLLRMLNISKITLHKQGHIYRLNIFESLPFAKIKNKKDRFSKTYYSLYPAALKSKKVYEIYKNYYNPAKNSSIKSRKIGKLNKVINFDYIKKIKNFPNTPYVYDLSVKDNENFIGGTGLFCFHNSIAEEGLDIPEVNEVIFYEPVPSAIRKIQRAGRTARLIKGSLKILITKKTRDEIYHYAAHHKEKRMYSAIDQIKKGFGKTEPQKRLFR